MKPIENINILVVGDIMLDKYVIGSVERISPEAPVPIINVKNEYHTLGGCGNVVRNICELGANVDCLSSIGDDINGNIICDELTKIGARSLLFYGSKQTTVKERIVADHRSVQMLRIDREEIKQIDPKLSIDIYTRMCKNDYDIIVISDYAKGMISYELMEYLKVNQNANIIVDPKPANGIMYNDVYMITPNESEWGSMVLSSAYRMDPIPFILVTKGKDGMTLIDNINNFSQEIEDTPIAVSNVSGCGDVVVAIVSTCLSIGYDPLISAKIANKCAGFTATLPGTSIIPKEKFNIYVKEILGEK